MISKLGLLKSMDNSYKSTKSDSYPVEEGRTFKVNIGIMGESCKSRELESLIQRYNKITYNYYPLFYSEKKNSYQCSREDHR